MSASNMRIINSSSTTRTHLPVGGAGIRTWRWYSDRRGVNLSDEPIAG